MPPLSSALPARLFKTPTFPPGFLFFFFLYIPPSPQSRSYCCSSSLSAPTFRTAAYRSPQATVLLLQQLCETALSERTSELQYSSPAKNNKLTRPYFRRVKMNRSAATPDKSNQTFSKEVSKVAVPYLDPLTSSANGKQPSPQGPSPASTYGDTATGDSVPPTPIEGGGRGKSATSPIPFPFPKRVEPLFLILPSLAIS